MPDYSRLNERELLLLMQQEEDHLAFSEIYHRFSHFLLAYAYKITQDSSDTQDIVQNIFVSLWTNRKRLTIESSLCNYLIRSVRFGFYKSLRSKQTFSKYEADLQRYLLQEHHAIDEYILEKELMERLEKLAEGFPENMGKVFVMAHFEGLSPKNIAEILHISERTVHNLISQASKRARLGMGLGIALAILTTNHVDNQCFEKNIKKNSIFCVKI
ncbi:sigma-70 family RNA polymerase sigma factor [Sphingobacterium sp. SGG-5]|uniref:RNA polymerase sigma factor n=1 Tax=Sphingobacterium sp. SGG-5 TaxID=2710881 RepID=UPI0013ECEAA1|nr:sigma-70 family RNA polymerase sigma factor [Sphingobacterium sp. SGG-5]NGM63310.1 sigma-70 family RNA polymerase sigma factor [Sphingobacterium sp. SGG-5]